MLSIGEFSKICKVTTKTLRYYDEIGLIKPSKINQENGYRYYSIEQLETMLFINRLKQYKFSLEEIKEIITSEEILNEKLSIELYKKKVEFEKQIQIYSQITERLNDDISVLKQGKSIMSYLNKIDVQLVEVPVMYLVSIRKMVCKFEMEEQYACCFNSILRKIQYDKLTVNASPMVLFHGDEFTPLGLDTEFAIPVEQFVTGTRDFCPGLCLKTTLHGGYSNLPSIYTKQCEWAEQNGYENNGPLFEVYITDPAQTSNEDDLVTEIYYPVKKK